MFLLIWVVALTAALILYFRQVYCKMSRRGVKHEPVLPLLGNMTTTVLGFDHIIESLDRLYKAFPEERFVGRYEFMTPIVLVKDLEVIKRITIKDFEHFLDHRTFSNEKVEPLFARNLFSLKGQEWKEMRSAITPIFTSSKIRLMVPFMEEVGKQMVQALKRDLKMSQSEYIDVDCKDLTSRFSNDAMATCAFGLKVDSHLDKDNKFYNMVKTASTFKFKQMLIFFLGSAFPCLSKWLNLKFFSDDTKHFFLDLVLGIMNKRESRKIIRPDMIHLLMEVKKGQQIQEEKEVHNGDTGFATLETSEVGKNNIDKATVWSDTDLVAQAVVFFIAGFETMSIAMSFALYELALNPEVQDRLVQEIKKCDEMNNGKLDFTSIQNMEYMDMVVSESLRISPSGFTLDRLCVKDYNLGKPNDKATKDYILRKGEVVYIPAWSIHHDPRYFPDPEKFNPERFSNENKHTINPMTYMPFGLGPRNCISPRFALFKLKVLIYIVLLHMEVSPSEKTCVTRQLDRGSFTLRLHGGHWLRFKLRA